MAINCKRNSNEIAANTGAGGWSTYRSDGCMQKNADGSGWTDVTAIQQLTNLAQMEFDTFRYSCVPCKKRFSCKAGWYKHITFKRNHSCICDIFKCGKYSHTVNAVSAVKFKRQFKQGELRELEAEIEKTQPRKTLGKRSNASADSYHSVYSAKKKIRKGELQMAGKKIPALVGCSKKSLERMVGYLYSVKSRLRTVQEINALLFSQYKTQEQLRLLPLDDIFCDGMYFPRTILSDTTDKVRQLFEEVDLVVKSVKNSADE